LATANGSVLRAPLSGIWHRLFSLFTSFETPSYASRHCGGGKAANDEEAQPLFSLDHRNGEA